MTVRRRLSCVAILTAIVITAAGCSGSPEDSGSSAGDPVTLDLTWWGNSARAQATEQAVAAFEKEHPEIDVKPHRRPSTATTTGCQSRLPSTTRPT